MFYTVHMYGCTRQKKAYCLTDRTREHCRIDGIKGIVGQTGCRLCICVCYDKMSRTGIIPDEYSNYKQDENTERERCVWSEIRKKSVIQW